MDAFGGRRIISAGEQPDQHGGQGNFLKGSSLGDLDKFIARRRKRSVKMPTGRIVIWFPDPNLSETHSMKL